MTSPISTNEPEDFAESDIVDHRIIGARLRPQPTTAVLGKSIAAGVAAGLPAELAEALAHSAANQQQLRSALRSPKVQRFGTEEFTYIESDILTYRIVPSPDNVRFEGEHARGAINTPRFGAVTGKPLLTFEMDSAEDMINAMAAQISDMVEHNPHVPSIKDRGIETPGWLSFLQLTTKDVGSVVRLESTDGFGRTVGSQDGLGITFKDAAWNLRPGGRRAASLLRDLVQWANTDIVTDEQARKVRCSIMPNARVIIGYSAQRPFDRARRRFVAHLHMAPPMNFTYATTLNAKANAAVDNLYERGLLPVPAGMTAVEVRGILDGSVRDHDLLEDEVAVLACGTLNPNQNRREARAVNEAITDLTGVKPILQERTQLAAEVALRRLPNDKRLTALRAALERSWRWAPLRGVALTRREPLELLSEAIHDLVQTGDGTGVAIPELVTLASYHLVSGRTQLLTRSEFGRGDNVEPPQILRRMAKSDAGLRQLCQIILDGRAGRDPQELPDDTEPEDRRFRDASVLTPERLRELAEMSEEGISYRTPEDLFAAAIADFEGKLYDLYEAAKAVAAVVDDTGVALVDTVGFETTEVNTSLQDVVNLVAEWRSQKHRAIRMRPDLDSGARAR